RMQSPGDRPAGNASLAGVRWGCLTGRVLAVTRKRSTVTITQHSERVTDFTVTETQLPLLLTRFHPPEFR
ncbi:hypothetical protein MJT46_001472, partial [Ovis ammon polii x Ovis aries]